MARSVPKLLARSLALGAVLMLALGAATASATTLKFDPVGAERSFVVPAGVTAIHIVAIGARGGNGGAKVGVGGLGGPGDRVEGDIAVTPGQVLFIEVGGVGGSATQINKGGLGGFNGGADGGDNEPSSKVGGGGGGGGGSDVRLLSRSAGTASLQSRLLVAGGGGGGGGVAEVGSGKPIPAPGAGGAAGKAGGDSAVSVGFEPGRGGGGATATAGGKGGVTNGLPGTLGIGGTAEDLLVTSEGTASGGGGGGGAFGGGGGGRNDAKSGSAAGGGGGSSLFGPAVTGASIIREATEDPLVTLTYTAAGGPTPAPPGAPQTKLRFRPPALIETSKPKVGVQFRFDAGAARASFKCKLDKKKFKPCSSPKRYRVKPGKHVFKVKAIEAGVPDPTPVKFEFRVKRTG